MNELGEDLGVVGATRNAKSAYIIIYMILSPFRTR